MHCMGNLGEPLACFTQFTGLNPEGLSPKHLELQTGTRSETPLLVIQTEIWHCMTRKTLLVFEHGASLRSYVNR